MFLEPFNAGLSLYTLTGDSTMFSVATGGPYGGTFSVAQRTGLSGSATRPVAPSIAGFMQWSIKGRITAANAGWSASAALSDNLHSPGDAVQIFPRVAPTVDAGQRARVYVTTGGVTTGYQVGSTALVAGTWYIFDVALYADRAGFAQVRDASSGAVLYSAALPATALVPLNQLQILSAQVAATANSPTDFADMSVLQVTDIWPADPCQAWPAGLAARRGGL